MPSDPWWANPATRWLIERTFVPVAVFDEAHHLQFANEAFRSDLDANLKALGAPVDRENPSAAQAAARALKFQVPSGTAVFIDGDSLESQLAALHARLQKLEEERTTDSLTGAWNRRHLDTMIPVEIARSERYRAPLSLLLIDIDHFKRVNDTFGHAVGDDVLCALVDVMKLALRAADTLFRWGGEEFAVLTPSTGYRGAAVLAETLRAAVAGHSFPTVGNVTISVGVAEHHAAEDRRAWFERVDQALYSAKKAGRNLVAVDRTGNSDRWAGTSGVTALHLVWLEAYESGNATIDAQHQQLFTLANALIDAASAPDRFALPAAVDQLMAHLATHFRDEEAELANAGYTGLPTHQKEHEALLHRGRQLQSGIRGGSDAFGPVVDFLANTVVGRHLFTSDRRFFSLFSGHTVDVAGASTESERRLS